MSTYLMVDGKYEEVRLVVQDGEEGGGSRRVGQHEQVTVDTAGQLVAHMHTEYSEKGGMI